MIDIATEDLVPLKDLPKSLPKRNGRPVAITTVWRWATAGLKGVRLETILIGGQRFSSLAAFHRFVAAGNRGEVARPDVARAAERTNHALDAMGW